MGTTRIPIGFILLSVGLVLGGSYPIAAAEQPAEPAHAKSSREAYRFLKNLCDDFGGRLTGSTGNARALQRLEAELRALGLRPEYQSFTMPGWERGDDRVALLEPLSRPLRVAALSYTQPQPAFEADVVSMGTGRAEDYAVQSSGKVGLLAHNTPLQMKEIVATAKERGLKAILYINREAGGQLLARTGSFSGEPLPFPILSITQEEGMWLYRLLERGRPVRVKIQIESRCKEIETANLRVRFPGRSAETIVVGAHFDSWDIGQGAMDNGLGVAQLFALAHALRGMDLDRTVELIWLNGEEQGLWGSRVAASQIGDTPIVAMVNLDMVGVPIAINALGDESLVPALERFQAKRVVKLPQGVQNINWFGSDHTPYQLAGVRAVTFNAPIDRASVRYYHDLADTIDKLPESVVVDSTAVIADAILALVADRELRAFRRPLAQTEELFTRFGLERRMRATGLWPFAPR
ncbi:MAG TPA: M28 family peptidase [Opitutaceae bacterium]|nr:M28 family peptidase [Opitutaceae bacterium]